MDVWAGEEPEVFVYHMESRCGEWAWVKANGASWWKFARLRRILKTWIYRAGLNSFTLANTSFKIHSPVCYRLWLCLNYSRPYLGRRRGQITPSCPAGQRLTPGVPTAATNSSISQGHHFPLALLFFKDSIWRVSFKSLVCLSISKRVAHTHKKLLWLDKG